MGFRARGLFTTRDRNPMLRDCKNAPTGSGRGDEYRAKPRLLGTSDSSSTGRES